MINFGGTANRVEDAKLEFVFTNYTGDVILTGDSIAMGGLIWDSSTSVDRQFTIGGAVTGKLTINLFNDNDSLSIYDFRDSYLTAYLKMEGASNYTVMGQYYVGEFRYDGAMIALTAYDMMSKFDKPTSYLGNPAHTLTWPMSLKTMIQTACSICGVTLRDSTNPTPWDSYSITQKPQQWDSMTWHDVIAACAQISGTFAKIDAYGRLYFDWYDTSILSGTNEWDGGTFTGEAIPYADGDDLDGGTFDSWNTGDAADGGTFGDRANVHVIPSAYSLTVDTDDVVITGLKVTLEASDNIVQGEGTETYTTQLYGQEGYVITVSGNPFIETSANADAVKDFLGARVVGMMFRPLNASLIEDPTIEAGDVALIEGTNGNTYACFISHVTYTTNAATIISCDAESTGISSKVRFSMSDKIRNETEQIQRDVQAIKTISDITNQYFWFAESGVSQDVGTGAHITQIPQDDFIADPEHGGGNLLARSNGIALREGVHELTTLTQGGMEINSFDSNGNAVNIAHLGYGEGVAESGNANAPFFTFGTRSTGAIGNYSVAEGSDNVVSRPYSHAEGSNNSVHSISSHAEGMFNTVAYNFFGCGHAEGYSTRAEGRAAHSEGDNTRALSAGAHAQNIWTIASSAGQTALGKYNVEDNQSIYAVIIGNGTGPASTDRSNALTVDWNGAVSVADPDQTRLNLGIDCGYSQFEVGAQAYVTNTVTFNKTFSEPPIVVAGFFSSSTGAGMGRLSCGVFDVTTTECKIRVWSYDSSNRSPRVNWIAVGT